MNWVRIGILIVSVATAQAASSHKAGDSVPSSTATANADQIASARQVWQKAMITYGRNHPITALMLSNLALAMREAGYFNYAEQYAQQALTILESHFGPQDVSLTPALNVLAEAEVSEGRYAEAQAVATRAVAIGPDAGAHYATALHDLAAAYQAQGKLQLAADYYRQALEIREKVLPPGHPYTRVTRAALAQVERSAKTVARR